MTAWLTEVGSRRIAFGYRIERPDDGAELATAETSLVSVDAKGRPTRLPPDVLTHLEELMHEG